MSLRECSRQAPRENIDLAEVIESVLDLYGPEFKATKTAVIGTPVPRHLISPGHFGTYVALTGMEENVMSAHETAQQVKTESSGSGVVEVCRGSFTATVKPYLNRYAFAIRDREGERPVIHGYGMDQRSAIHAVQDLLETLAA